jgi:hypothetical protein
MPSVPQGVPLATAAADEDGDESEKRSQSHVRSRDIGERDGSEYPRPQGVGQHGPPDA